MPTHSGEFAWSWNRDAGTIIQQGDQIETENIDLESKPLVWATKQTKPLRERELKLACPVANFRTPPNSGLDSERVAQSVEQRTFNP